VRPWLERDFVKAFLGVPLFAVVTYSGIASLPLSEEVYLGWETSEPVATVLAYNQALPRDGDTVTYLLPVAVLNGVSQGYHTGHPGIDLMAPLGSGVLAMERGTVESVTYDSFGYGRHVRVTHLYGVKSLYAHLQGVWVQPGQDLVPGQTLGTIGLTGWSTGPHLHFEVMEADRTVNPMRYIGEGIEWAREKAGRSND
jgi:murein DD-endopeptidase MepM/ murein hydrolase activator NlpD